MKYRIICKNKYGTYKTFGKEFKDAKHFDNWYSFVEARGNKIIETTKI
jgi:hypothetical protein